MKTTKPFTRLGFTLEVSAVEVGLTLNTWPERLMTVGALPASELTSNVPVTRLPRTVGANSTPRLQSAAMASTVPALQVVL